MTDPEILKAVCDALDNATENRFPMIEMTDEAIAVDLCTCDADLETFEPEQLIPFVKIWKERNA